MHKLIRGLPLLLLIAIVSLLGVASVPSSAAEQCSETGECKEERGEETETKEECTWIEYSGGHCVPETSPGEECAWYGLPGAWTCHAKEETPAEEAPEEGEEDTECVQGFECEGPPVKECTLEEDLSGKCVPEGYEPEEGAEEELKEECSFGKTPEGACESPPSLPVENSCAYSSWIENRCELEEPEGDTCRWDETELWHCELTGAYILGKKHWETFGEEPPAVEKCPPIYAAGKYSLLVLEAHPVQYFSLSEGMISSLTCDSAANNEPDGSAANTPIPAAVAGGDSAQHFARRAYSSIDVPSTEGNTITGPFTFESWVSPDDWQTSIIAEKPGEYRLKTANGQFIVEINNNDGINKIVGGAQHEMLKGIWHQVAMVYDGTSVRLYVDGEQVSLETYSADRTETVAEADINPINIVTSDLAIGGKYYTEEEAYQLEVAALENEPWKYTAESSPTNLEGGMDEVAIYDHALAGTTIEAHYSFGHVFEEPPLEISKGGPREEHHRTSEGAVEYPTEEARTEDFGNWTGPEAAESCPANASTGPYAEMIRSQHPREYFSFNDNVEKESNIYVCDSSESGEPDGERGGNWTSLAPPGVSKGDSSLQIKRHFGGFAFVPSTEGNTITGPLTFEAWVYPEDWHNSIIAEKKGEYALWMRHGQLRMQVNTNEGIVEIETTPEFYMQLENWQQVAVVYDGTTLSIYIDGEQVPLAAYRYGGSEEHPENYWEEKYEIGITPVKASPQPEYLDIGGMYPTDYMYSGENMQGKIDEVAIYKYALSAERIKEHYELGTAPEEENGSGEEDEGEIEEGEFPFHYPTVFWLRNGSETYKNVNGTALDGAPTVENESLSGWAFSKASGELPEGMYLNEEGTLKGTPSNKDPANTETYHFNVKATKGGDSFKSPEITLVLRPSTPQVQLRPILRFDDGEKWRPLNVNDFLQESFPSQYPRWTTNQRCQSLGKEKEEQLEEHIKLEISEGKYEEKDRIEKEETEGGEGELILGTCEPFSTGKNAVEENNAWFTNHESQEYELNVHGAGGHILGGNGDPDSHYTPDNCPENISEALLDCEQEGAALYWHHIRNGEGLPEKEAAAENKEALMPSGIVYYDYWAYYRYNQYELPAPASGDEGDHESDWEGIVVASNSENEDPTGFEWVGMSAHKNTWRYLNGTLYCDYEEVENSCQEDMGGNGGQRVEAFVAKGDHGEYPRPCSANCDRTDPDPGEQILGEQNFGGEEYWLENNNSASLENLNYSKNEPWAKWKGNWSRGAEEIFVGSPLRQPHGQEPWNLYTKECTERYKLPYDTSEGCGEGSEEKVVEQEAMGSVKAMKQNPCRSWEGPFVQASICDPGIIQEQVNKGELDKKGDVSIVDADTGQTTLTDSAPGIAQLVSEQPIPANTPIVIRGHLSPTARIHLLIETKNGTVYATSLVGKELGTSIRSLSVHKHGHRFIANIKYRRCRKHHQCHKKSHRRVSIRARHLKRVHLADTKHVW